MRLCVGLCPSAPSARLPLPGGWRFPCPPEDPAPLWARYPARAPRPGSAARPAPPGPRQPSGPPAEPRRHPEPHTQPCGPDGRRAFACGPRAAPPRARPGPRPSPAGQGPERRPRASTRPRRSPPVPAPVPAATSPPATRPPPTCSAASLKRKRTAEPETPSLLSERLRTEHAARRRHNPRRTSFPPQASSGAMLGAGKRSRTAAGTVGSRFRVELRLQA